MENLSTTEHLTDNEKYQILECIYENDIDTLKNLGITKKDLNFRVSHPKTELDDLITPLASAAFLGRLEITHLLLENPFIDVNLTTEDNGFSPLSAACASGLYEMARLLSENGADVNYTNTLGQTPLVYCFSRLDEENNVYENKNLCLKMAELLLSQGADINTIIERRNNLTLLMRFCSISFELDPIQLDINLEVIKFLLEHGSDRNLKSKQGLTAFQLCDYHCKNEEVKNMLQNVKQIYFYKNKKHQDGQSFFRKICRKKEENGLVIEDQRINCGCCTIWAMCNK